MTCPNCKSETLFTFKVGRKDRCNKCKDAPAPKKKMGRPVTKTPEERKAKHEQWFIDNREHRLQYLKDYYRRKKNEN